MQQKPCSSVSTTNVKAKGDSLTARLHQAEEALGVQQDVRPAVAYTLT